MTKLKTTIAILGVIALGFNQVALGIILICISISIPKDDDFTGDLQYN